MDISDTLQPNSDQLDAIELATGPRTFTIRDVGRGNAEQPVNIFLAELDRPWRPGKSMRRVLAACWGTDASKYIGRRVRLYFDPNVTFGKDKVGGTRIEALSHIEKEHRVPLLVARGKTGYFNVKPLPNDAPASPQASTGEIPADVIATAEKAKASGHLADYLNHLETNGAPDAIKAYVRDQMEQS